MRALVCPPRQPSPFALFPPPRHFRLGDILYPLSLLHQKTRSVAPPCHALFPSVTFTPSLATLASWARCPRRLDSALRQGAARPAATCITMTKEIIPFPKTLFSPCPSLARVALFPCSLAAQYRQDRKRRVFEGRS